MNSLLYIGDPMCSWCWGIAPHLERLKDHFKDHLNFSLVLGGLRPGGREPWDQAMKDFLRDHWNHVHEASGQPFNFELLDSDQFTYDTEPSCRAVRVVRDLAPLLEFDFFKLIQKSFYQENRDPGESEFYRPLCNQLEVRFDDFINKFQSEEYRDLVQQDFFYSHRLGVTGFPSVLLKTEMETYAVTLGYSHFDAMKHRVDRILEIGEKEFIRPEE